jgi:exonuclease III
VSNQTVCNLQRFQNLVYNENSDIICVNETWLNNSISNEDTLHSGFTIYRKDRKDRYGGGVLEAIKTDLFKSVKEFSPNGEEFEDLEIVSTELRTVTDKKIIFCCCYIVLLLLTWVGWINLRPFWIPSVTSTKTL